MWEQLIACLGGIWLILSPWVLGFQGPAAGLDRLLGPVAAALGVMAAWSVVRPVRWINLPVGLTLVVAPWFLGSGRAAVANTVALGVVVTVASLLGDGPGNDYDGGWHIVIFGGGDDRGESGVAGEIVDRALGVSDDGSSGDDTKGGAVDHLFSGRESLIEIGLGVVGVALLVALAVLVGGRIIGGTNQSRRKGAGPPQRGSVPSSRHKAASAAATR